MKQLKPLSISQLSTAELQYLTLQTTRLIENLIAIDVFANKQYTCLQSGTDRVEALTGLSLKNDATLTLNSSDDIQDSILIGVRETCKAKIATSHFDEDGAKSAEQILDVMGEYGKSLIYGTYEEQCVAIPSFITQMSTAENEVLSEKTGVKLFIDALIPAHDEFTTLLNQKLTNTSKPMVNLTDTKKEIRYRLEGLLTYIDLQIADDVAECAALRIPLNLLITEVMAQMKTRITLAKKNKLN